MPAEKFQNKYRIGTKRASWHDYNDGEYFITICTKDRVHYFGEIVDGEMQLSAVGKYTDECVQKISEHNPYAQIPEYVIMPDHIGAFLQMIPPMEKTKPCKKWPTTRGVYQLRWAVSNNPLHGLPVKMTFHSNGNPVSTTTSSATKTK